MNDSRKRFLNEIEAASYLALSRSYLRKSRMKQSNIRGPRWRKLGRRVVYDIADLDDFGDSLPHEGGAP